MGEAQLTLLARLLDRIEVYRQALTPRDIAEDLDAWLRTKAALETAAQCAIDLALAIVAARSLGAPQSYRAAFATLADAGVLDRELAAELQGWAGLRNVLAHLYTDIDVALLHAALGDTASLRHFHKIAAQELRGQREP